MVLAFGFVVLLAAIAMVVQELCEVCRSAI
jgi:hypothetical protein